MTARLATRRVSTQIDLYSKRQLFNDLAPKRLCRIRPSLRHRANVRFPRSQSETCQSRNHPIPDGFRRSASAVEKVHS